MSNENPNTEDLRDQLIDGALREVVGGEIPSDLADQILFAASSEQTDQLATLPPTATQQGENAMTTPHQQADRYHNVWVGIVLAASLLLAAGLIWPTLDNQGELAKSYQPANKQFTSDATPSNDGRTAQNTNEFRLPDVEIDSVRHDSPDSKAEFDALLDKIMTDSWDDNKSNSELQPFPSNLSLKISQSQQVVEGGATSTDTSPLPPIRELPSVSRLYGLQETNNDSLMMSVTPHIIIQEEKEERLSADLGGRASGQGQGGEGYSVELGRVPFTDNPPIAYPDTKEWAELTAKREKWAAADLSEERGRGSRTAPEKLAVKVHPAADLVLPTESDGILAPDGPDNSLAGDPSQAGAEGKEQEDRKLAATRGRERRLSRQLNEKILLYQGLASNIRFDVEAKVNITDGYSLADVQQAQQEVDNLRRLALVEQGKGPGNSGDKYTRIYENPFIETKGEKAVSTFSIDVDTASYANVRQFLMQSGQLPPPDAVRLEELVNYFEYDYSGPTDDTPFAAHVEVAGCPWQADHRLVRVGIKGREIETDHRPLSNLVFLIDVSGSMNQPAKLPLLVEGMKLLTRELSENDRVAIVVYASSEGLALPSTRGDKQDTILAALEKLRAGGSTAGGAGIELAYKIAQENFIEGGVNRVILATDGDFNVGTTSTAALEQLAETNAKETGVFLTVLGFGRGNLNDEMMEAISGKGNGNYHYIDNQTEAQKVLVAEMAGTLVTIAKDVKIQIEFNPAQVAGYRLLGYENRMLKTEDFNNDKKDAGEIGAGHTVTAIYEIVPAGTPVGTPAVDPLKYQSVARPADDENASDELLTLKLRYKQPDEDTSTKLEFPITDNGQSFTEASGDFKFASAVASFGMLLRNSVYRGATSYSAVEEIAQEGTGEDRHGYRAEFVKLVRQARQLAGE